MNKYFILLFIVVSLSVLFVLNLNTPARRNQPAFAGPTPTPVTMPEIEKFEMDRDKVFIQCPPGIKPQEKCNDNGLIKVKTSAVNPRNTELLYHYTVSGGRIIGQGKNVTWDLLGVRPGTYSITVSIDDGSESYIKSQTKTIEVKECYCPFVDACPIIEISIPTDLVKAGETVTFTAKMSGDFVSDNTSYDWTVSAGTIVTGQGTPTIKVETTREMADGNLTATVQISSDRIAGICERTASETVSITK